jgi:hypothetical protein
MGWSPGGWTTHELRPPVLYSSFTHRCGDRPGLAATKLLRFDPVSGHHFKSNGLAESKAVILRGHSYHIPGKRLKIS